MTPSRDRSQTPTAERAQALGPAALAIAAFSANLLLTRRALAGGERPSIGFAASSALILGGVAVVTGIGATSSRPAT